MCIFTKNRWVFYISRKAYIVLIKVYLLSLSEHNLKYTKYNYCCIMIAKNTLGNYYNLKAVESTEGSDFSHEEFSKLVNALIDNP
jgi:hypothetical protein